MFKDKRGLQFPGVSVEKLDALYSELQNEWAISYSQMSEAASFSMAMVVRFALGLSASGGAVVALVNDSLSGLVALGTLRHLINAGSLGRIIVVDHDEKKSQEFSRLITTLQRTGAEILNWSNAEQEGTFGKILSSSHNLLYGVWGKEIDQNTLKTITETLNEFPTPVHTIQSPSGINATTGAATPTPLYASSTLSLGMPLSGLSSGAEFVGRHYLCDVCIPPQKYNDTGFSCGPLFNEQPVIQIFPIENNPEGA